MIELRELVNRWRGRVEQFTDYATTSSNAEGWKVLAEAYDHAAYELSLAIDRIEKFVLDQKPAKKRKPLTRGDIGDGRAGLHRYEARHGKRLTKATLDRHKKPKA